LRKFRTGTPIPAVLSVFVTERDDHRRPTLIAAIAGESPIANETAQPLLAALAEADRRCREQQALAELSRLAVTADLDTVLAAATATVTAQLGRGVRRWPGWPEPEGQR
jgi:hypothetical protein